MSQLVEKLRRASRAAAPPLGFRRGEARPEPGMVFIARLSAGETPPAGADALLLEPARKPPKAVVAAGLLWGVVAEGLSAPEMAELEGKGCDFLLLPSLEAPVAEAGKLGRLLLVDPSLPDSLVRAADAVADALAVDLSRATPLTLRHLLECSRLAGLSRLPLLALAPPSWSGQEVGWLGRAGVRGVVAGKGAPLEEWRSAPAAPAAPTPVLLPQPQPQPQPPPPAEEGEE